VIASANHSDIIQDATESLGAVVILGQQSHRESLQSETSSDVEKPVLSGAASRDSVARNTMQCAQTVRAFVLSDGKGSTMNLTGSELELFEEYENSAKQNLECDLAITREALIICGSPLEQRFLITFLSFNGQADVAYAPDGENGFRFGCDMLADSFFWIEPQRKISVDGHNYRADFLITYKTRKPLTTRLRIVIEIDGHDFHEKTKEQALRDKSRDRLMAREGYVVMRFTGSEIFNDPQNAAAEVWHFLHKFERQYMEEGTEREEGE
jgi:very-short-patch-repair endonuclease